MTEVTEVFDHRGSLLSADHLPDAEKKAPAECRWHEDRDGNYATACGGLFCLDEGTPAENHMRFCCYCGRPLVAVLYEEPANA